MIMERFWSKVEKTNGCWNWKASGRGVGYGAFRYNGKIVDAHRMAYMLVNGPIPDNLLVCHTCDNRACVNPEHLFLGTYSDNMLDCSKKGRLYKRPVRNDIHPSQQAYSYGCRCDKCKAMQAARIRDYRRRKKLQVA